ncbi:Dabb family protein [Methylomonas sp. LL1]|nr:Dabb family protein [Methylomonas sp. LL1]
MSWRSRLAVVILAGLLAGCATMQRAESRHRLHHLVVIWLKQPGDEKLRQQYIAESKPLSQLPGVLAYDVGTPAAVKRSHASSALDQSYDVAIASVFESQQAFEAFLKNPEYGRIAKDVLRPLVDRYTVYDFID